MCWLRGCPYSEWTFRRVYCTLGHRRRINIWAYVPPNRINMMVMVRWIQMPMASALTHSCQCQRENVLIEKGNSCSEWSWWWFTDHAESCMATHTQVFNLPSPKYKVTTATKRSRTWGSHSVRCLQASKQQRGAAMPSLGEAKRAEVFSISELVKCMIELFDRGRGMLLMTKQSTEMKDLLHSGCLTKLASCHSCVKPIGWGWCN